MNHVSSSLSLQSRLGKSHLITNKRVNGGTKDICYGLWVARLSLCYRTPIKTSNHFKIHMFNLNARLLYQPALLEDFSTSEDCSIDLRRQLFQCLLNLPKLALYYHGTGSVRPS